MFWFLFVDWNAQSKLVGEYYVKSFMKTIFAIMCIKGVFALYVFGLFSVRRRGRRRRSRSGSSHMLPRKLPGEEGGASG